MQDTIIAGREPPIAMDNLIREKQSLMQELLGIVILVNLIVLISIVLVA